MAQPAFEAIVEDFEFLEDWEDRYRHVIELGKAMDPLDEALKVPANKVQGCASQVWLFPSVEDGIFRMTRERAVIHLAVLRTLYNDLPVTEVGKVDAQAELSRLGLQDHLSAQRSNGLRSMIARIREVAA